MNTAISVTGTGVWDTADHSKPAPIPPGETGADYSGGTASPVPDMRPTRADRPCTAVSRPAAIPRTAAPRRGPALSPTTPDELREEARVGYAATAMTALLTAAVVIGFLTLAHLRVPDPQPVPIPAGVPAVDVAVPDAR